MIHDSIQVVEGEASRENRMDLGGTEKETAKISDLDLLKVIGKGSFGKVRREGRDCVVHLTDILV